MNGREAKERRRKAGRSVELPASENPNNVGGAQNAHSSQEGRLKWALNKAAYTIKAAIVCIVLLALIGGCCRIVQVCTYHVFFGGMVEATIQQTVKPNALR